MCAPFRDGRPHPILVASGAKAFTLGTRSVTRATQSSRSQRSMGRQSPRHSVSRRPSRSKSCTHAVALKGNSALAAAAIDLLVVNDVGAWRRASRPTTISKSVLLPQPDGRNADQGFDGRVHAPGPGLMRSSMSTRSSNLPEEGCGIDEILASDLGEDQ